MNTLKLIVTAALFAATGAAFAADTTPAPEQAAAKKADLALTQAVSTERGDYATAGFQAAAPGKGERSRAEVRAEAVEAVKNHRSTLAESLDLSRN
ncbi:hypothetical protein HSX11_12385 [Oxalobacteraceae bacterium]|nr:hypothetical protein [Oxalobacteraceae bacterium]